MATRRPKALPSLVLTAALGVPALTAAATVVDRDAARPVPAHVVSAGCASAADWNTMVPEGECQAQQP